jgi:hypothetical protein
MRRVADLRKWLLAIALAVSGLACGAVAQVSKFLPEIDAYYKVTNELGSGCRQKQPTKPVIP